MTRKITSQRKKIRKKERFRRFLSTRIRRCLKIDQSTRIILLGNLVGFHRDFIPDLNIKSVDSAIESMFKVTTLSCNNKIFEIDSINNLNNYFRHIVRSNRTNGLTKKYDKENIRIFVAIEIPRKVKR